MKPEIIKNNKIAFIICVNNRMYLDECCAYIERLTVPQGYEVEVFPVWDSSSMCQAYNVGMNASDAKYKIYIHQDVFIVEENFLNKIVHIFKNNENIGMIGMIGATDIPKSGVFFNACNIGKVEVREEDMPYYCVAGKDTGGLQDVLAVDGVLMATQADIPWREDLFGDYDFYDASQGLEFIKAGYRVVVPEQEKPWIIHNCGFAKLGKYDKNRQIFIKNYSEFLTYDSGMDFDYNGEWDVLSSQLVEIVKKHIESGQWGEVDKIINLYHRNNYKNTELERQAIVNEIYKAEQREGKCILWKSGMSYNELMEKYCRIRFSALRYELGWDDDTTKKYKNEIISGAVSIEALMTMLPHVILYKKAYLSRLYNDISEDISPEHKQRIEALTHMMQNDKLNIAYGRRYMGD